MRVLAILSAIMLLAGAGDASAQALPYHVDPSAREIVPNLAPVPAIRFLTTADFPPFNYRDADGELIGFNVDLAAASVPRSSVACTIQAWPWEQAATALEDNQGDALIAGLAITPENGELFDFSSIYLALPAASSPRVCRRAGFDPAALDGRRGGAARLDARGVHPPLSRRGQARASSTPRSRRSTRSRRARSFAYFGDALRASFWLNDHPAAALCRRALFPARPVRRWLRHSRCRPGTTPCARPSTTA